MSTQANPPRVASAQKIPGLAIASLVLGIASIMGAAVLIIPTILAIVFGHVSYARIRKNPELTGQGIAVAGFVTGYVSIIFGVIIAGLLAAMAIPAFAKVREASMQKVLQNEARQIGAAAQAHLQENPGKPVTFHIENGVLTGPLGEYVKRVSPQTREVDGVIDSATDTFSLQSPQAYNGRVVVFSIEGQVVSERAP